MENTKKVRSGGFFSDCIRSTLIAAVISTIAVLILGLLVRFTSIGDKAIVPINQVLKILAILAGCLFGVKEAKGGLLKGLVAGILFALFSFLALGSAFGDFSVFSILDFCACAAAGGVSGIISVNVRNKK